MKGDRREIVQVPASFHTPLAPFMTSPLRAAALRGEVAPSAARVRGWLLMQGVARTGKPSPGADAPTSPFSEDAKERGHELHEFDVITIIPYENANATTEDKQRSAKDSRRVVLHCDCCSHCAF